MAARKTKTKDAAPRKLLRVRPGFYLHWPPSLKNPNGAEGSGRGGPGYVVDLDLPHEREWCAGQMHKLEAIAPRDQAGVEPNPVDDCAAAFMARARAMGKVKEPTPPEPVADAKDRTAAAGADVKADDAMLPMGDAEPGADAGADADDDEPMTPEA